MESRPQGTEEFSYPGEAGPLSFTDTLKGQNCAPPPSYSAVDTGAALSAALVALEAWAEEGTPAPASQVFARDADGKVQRDAAGLPVGGLQLPEFVVPATRYAINGPTVFCTLSGYSVDLTPAEMTARYGTKERLCRGCPFLWPGVGRCRVSAARGHRSQRCAGRSGRIRTVTTAVTPRPTRGAYPR